MEKERCSCDRLCRYWLERRNTPACENALGLIALVMDFSWDEAEAELLKNFFEEKLKQLRGEY